MKRLGEWSIGQRIAAGFGAVICVLTLFAGLAIRWQMDGVRAQREFTERVLPRGDAAHDLERSIGETAVAIRNYLLDPDAQRASGAAAAVEAARTSLRKLAAFPKDADGAQLFSDTSTAVERYLDQVSAAAKTGRLANREAVEASLSESRRAAVRHVDAYVGLQRSKSWAAIKEMEAARDRVGYGLYLTFAVVCAAIVAMALATILWIRRPAGALTAIARELQAGNWQAALHYSPRRVAERGETPAPRNELAQIALAFGAAAEALERRESRLKADAMVANAASASLDKTVVAGSALRAMAEGSGAAMGAIYWRDAGSGALEAIAGQALPEGAARLGPAEGLPGQAASERRLVVLDDIPAGTPLRLRLGIDEAAPRAVAAVPLMLRGEVLGVAVLASLHAFDAEAREFLESAARQLAIGLQNVRAHEEAQRLLEEVRQAHEQVQAQNEELQAQSEELQAQSEELQAQSEELQTQNEELQQRSEELAQADERKNDFLGLLAHELRNPLAAIANSMFILGRGPAPAAPQAGAMAVMERQMRYLTRLIDDLLDVTRITRGKLHLQREPLDFTEVVRDSVNDCRRAAESAGIELATLLPPAPVFVHGDRTRLAQVLGNLLNNAIKFSEPGGKVEVELRLQPEIGKILLQVRDTGIGIEPALAERLFQPFSQGDMGLARGRGGLGLGLALSKALVELHDGRIEAHSAGPGAGAELSVTLPMGIVRPADAGATAPEPRAAPCRILVIEDNEDAGDTLRIALEFEGHEVAVARTGLEGVELARASPPQVILCDIGIPGIDGFEVARRLRADPRLRSTRLIALSGYATQEDRRRSAAAGFDHHLAKPVEIDTLLAALAAAPKVSRADAPA